MTLDILRLLNVLEGTIESIFYKSSFCSFYKLMLSSIVWGSKIAKIKITFYFKLGMTLGKLPLMSHIQRMSTSQTTRCLFTPVWLVMAKMFRPSSQNLWKRKSWRNCPRTVPSLSISTTLVNWALKKARMPQNNKRFPCLRNRRRNQMKLPQQNQTRKYQQIQIKMKRINSLSKIRIQKCGPRQTCPETVLSQ